MNLKQFSKTNLQRCTSPEGFNHPLASWSIAEWTNALAGEAGEACNVAKKLIRHRDGLAGNVKPEDLDQDGLRQRLAGELADVIAYADLAMQALGCDTSEVLARNFNAKSRALGCPIVFLEHPPSLLQPATAPTGPIDPTLRPADFRPLAIKD